MKNRTFLAIIATLFIGGFPFAANARDWWLSVVATRTCLPSIQAAEQMGVAAGATPYQLEMFARSGGLFDKTEIVSKDSDGNPSVVNVTVIGPKGNKILITYFSTLEMCQRMAATLPKPSDLN